VDRNLPSFTRDGRLDEEADASTNDRFLAWSETGVVFPNEWIKFYDVANSTHWRMFIISRRIQDTSRRAP